MPSKLDQLKAFTVIVADTGDVDAVARLRPEDCTTNPSLVLKAVQDPRFEPHLKAALAAGYATTEDVADDLTITIGVELAALVPGRVSTEVDARLSFDTQASLAKARAIIAAYQRRGVGRERVLIKLAATWEGIEAARRLQDEGIDCNLTLVFSLAQAAACADAGVFLISPFVGRITDWHSKATGRVYSAEEDPGVASVRRIYAYYKARGIPTIVMGASFRTTGQITALAGCDRLTISPALLDDLQSENGDLIRALPKAGFVDIETVAVDEASFRWMMNKDAMATEKLAEGIRNFHADAIRLSELIAGFQNDGR